MTVVNLHTRTTSLDLRQRRAAIAASIALLLSHYYLPDVSEEVRTAQAKDWLDDLVDFSAEIVASACQDWRRTQNRRPTIADIRGLCFREREERRSPDWAALPSPEARNVSKHREQH